MITDWFPKTRSLIAGSAFAEELTQFGTWLDAGHYAPVIIHSHVFRADRILERLPRVGSDGERSVAAVRTAFGQERKPLGRLNAYQATRRVYERFLAAQGRLLTRACTTPSPRFDTITPSIFSTCADCRCRRGNSTPLPLPTSWAAASHQVSH